MRFLRPFLAVACILWATDAFAVDCQYRFTTPTLSNQDLIILQCDSSGHLIVTNGSIALSSNITQFGGNNVATGTGASGVGVPRVTVANDSSVLTPFTGVVGNGLSTITLTSATTAITANQAIVPASGTQSFTIGNSAGAVFLQRARLISNDTTSTAWPSVVVNIDLWTAAPTGLTDRTTYAPTGVANWIGQLQCTFSAIIYGDGFVANCNSPNGVGLMPKLASGTTIYWTAWAATASGVTGAFVTLTDAARNAVEEFFTANLNKGI
jgi:hypothetical protein